jgi:hypothetical protein
MLRRADLEPFDLPAYRDLLLLHVLARDLPVDAAVDGDTPVVSPTVAASPTTPAFLARVVPPEPAPSDAAAQATVDLLLPLGEQMLEITLPQPHLADRPLAQSMLADWVFSRAARQRGPGTGVGDGLAGEPSAAAMRLDLDLSEHAPAPREFTRPAAFTDIDMRRDRRLSDLGGLEDGDPLPSRR